MTSPVAPNDHTWDRSALDLVNQIWAIPSEWPPTRRRAYAQTLIIEALKAARAGGAEMKLECEMCASSKWKTACPECNGTGEIIVSEKIRYWWSEDRQFFCILVNDGTSQATVSLTVKEAEALMGEVMQTPSFLKLQDEAFTRALGLMTSPVASRS